MTTAAILGKSRSDPWALEKAHRRVAKCTYMDERSIRSDSQKELYPLSKLAAKGDGHIIRVMQRL